MAKQLILVNGAKSKIGEEILTLFYGYDEDEFTVVGIDKKRGPCVDHVVDPNSPIRMQYLRSLYPNGFDYIINCTERKTLRCKDPLNLSGIFIEGSGMITEHTKLAVLIMPASNNQDDIDSISTKAIARTHCKNLDAWMREWGGRCELLNPAGYDFNDAASVKELAESIEGFLSITAE